MTSSLKATGQASVRGTPAATDAVAGAWALHELSLPAPRETRHDVSVEDRAAAMELTAKEQARLIDEGYARGLVDGEQKANAAAQARVNEALAVVNKIAVQLRDVASIAPAILEENVAALAVIVARQIISRAVAVDREVVADLVRRALTEFPVEQSVRIRVHPLDLSLLTMNGGAADSPPITGTRDTTWLADPRILRGGCLLEGRDRIIDGRVDTALERAYRCMAQLDAA